MSEEAPTPSPATPKGGLVPYLNLVGAAKAADFYVKAFGAQEVFRYPVDEQGRTMHIHLYVNDSSLMLGDFYPEHGHAAVTPQGYTVQLILKSGIDEAYQRAVDAGCTPEMPVQKMFWGDRWGSLRDPWGVAWAMNQPDA